MAANKRAEVGKGLSADLVVDPHATLAAIQEPQFVSTFRWWLMVG